MLYQGILGIRKSIYFNLERNLGKTRKNIRGNQRILAI